MATFPAHHCQAASLILDSFDQGEFTLTLEDSTATNAVELPLAQRRTASISSRQAEKGTSLSSILSPGGGQVWFAANGSSNSPNTPLYFELHYSQGGPYTISGCAGFKFQFSELIGAGNLIIDVGTNNAIYGPGTHRIPLNSAGDVFYPMGDVNFGAAGTPESFYTMRIRFEPVTTEFSFVLEEITLVPEPSAALIFLSAGLGVLTRRCRLLQLS